jgi:3',5'-cyclic AMP phosphodiesterase CpdA
MQAQSPRSFFIQLADPQFGAFTQDKDFVQETANYEFAVANINRLRPAFVVICGDLINKGGDAAQLAEYKRITAKIDPSIPVYAVAGNHDVENQPTPESIAAYRRNIGPDYYSFQRSGCLRDRARLEPARNHRRRRRRWPTNRRRGCNRS